MSEHEHIQDAKDFNRCSICEAEKRKKQTYSNVKVFINGVEFVEVNEITIEGKDVLLLPGEDGEDGEDGEGIR